MAQRYFKQKIDNVTIEDWILKQTISSISLKEDKRTIIIKELLTFLTRYMDLIKKGNYFLDIALKYPRTAIDYLSLIDTDFLKISIGASVIYDPEKITDAKMKQVVSNLIIISRFQELTYIYSCYNIARELNDKFKTINKEELDKLNLITLESNLLFRNDERTVEELLEYINEKNNNNIDNILPETKEFDYLKKRLPILFYLMNKVGEKILKKEKYWKKIKESTGFIGTMQYTIIENYINNPETLPNISNLPKELQSSIETYLGKNINYT